MMEDGSILSRSAGEISFPLMITRGAFEPSVPPRKRMASGVVIYVVPADMLSADMNMIFFSVYKGDPSAETFLFERPANSVNGSLNNSFFDLMSLKEAMSPSISI